MAAVGLVPPGSRAQVITVSDRSFSGSRADTSGPLLGALLAELGFDVAAIVVVPDEVPQVRAALLAAVGAGHHLIVTTGGTGLAPRDVTPEATAPLLDRQVPGLAEALRRYGQDRVPTTLLSRAVAGTIGSSLVVNLPGSTGGVRDGVSVLGPVVGHVISQLRGGDH